MEDQSKPEQQEEQGPSQRVLAMQAAIESALAPWAQGDEGDEGNLIADLFHVLSSASASVLFSALEHLRPDQKAKFLSNVKAGFNSSFNQAWEMHHKQVELNEAAERGGVQ